MAKESMKARERKRQRIVAKYAAKRKSLKEAKDYVGLQKLPKNASPTYLVECWLTALTKQKQAQGKISVQEEIHSKGNRVIKSDQGR